MQYYHGSPRNWNQDSILSGRGEDYVKSWGDSPFYAVLEMYRPENKIAHHNAVFMCESDEDIDLCGGSTDWVLVLKPLGTVHKHDINWSSEISCLLSDGYAIDSPEVINAATAYWSSEPHYNESVWEYLTTSASAIVIDSYEY